MKVIAQFCPSFKTRWTIQTVPQSLALLSYNMTNHHCPSSSLHATRIQNGPCASCVPLGLHAKWLAVNSFRMYMKPMPSLLFDHTYVLPLNLLTGELLTPMLNDLFELYTSDRNVSVRIQIAVAAAVGALSEVFIQRCVDEQKRNQILVGLVKVVMKGLQHEVGSQCISKEINYIVVSEKMAQKEKMAICCQTSVSKTTY